MIEAVVFDVGRVLYQWRLAGLVDKMTDDPAERDHILAEVITEEWHFQHDAGRPLAEMVPERIAAFPHAERFLTAYWDRFNETIPGPVPGSLEIVRDLNAAGVPLYAITNFGAEFWAAFRPTAPVFDLFREIVVSGEEKLVKPDSAIYALAARRFGHSPAAMIFIDDNLANVEAARACGWHAHHFVDAAWSSHGTRLACIEKPPTPWRRGQESHPMERGGGDGIAWFRRCSAPVLRRAMLRPW